jgi:hypothetical protein
MQVVAEMFSKIEEIKRVTKYIKLGMVVHTCNSRTLEAEARGMLVTGQPAILSLCLREKEN